MKPIYVKMSAFGSYAGEEIVDFTEVNHGLFLVTGDTGAGKTTIFDAITYALYDETSGGKRDGEMMRSQYAEEDIRTFVELKFIYHGETYTINRFPKQNRISKKKNKDGEYTMTVDSPSIELIMPDGLPYKGKMKEINQKIIDIVGLDVNQFTQIAMIAQGDFLKLLHAPSKERKEIFAKIFNTKIYWRIEEELKSRAKAMYGKLEDNRKDIEREMENVQCVEESALVTQWAELPYFIESDSERLIDLLHEIIEEAKAKEDEINGALRINQEALDKLLTDIKQASDINKLFAALENAQRKKEELEGKKEEIENIKVRMDKAKRASLIVPKETIYLAKKKDLEDCKHRITDIKVWLEENQELLEKLKSAKVNSEVEYKKKNPELSAKINKINELLPKYELLEEKISLREVLAEKKVKSKSFLDTVIKNMDLAKERQDKLTSEQEGLKTLSNLIALLTQSVDKLTENKKALETLLKQIKLLQEYRTAFVKVEKDNLIATEDLEAKKQFYEVMYHQFIEGQAGILAAELTEGCACPVCGSTSHPKKAEFTDTRIGQKELQDAKKQMETAVKVQQDKYDTMQQAKQRYENEKNLAEHEGKKVIGANFDAEIITDAELQNSLKECLKQLDEETGKKTKAEAAKKTYDTNENEIKKLNDDIKAYVLKKESAEKALKEYEISLMAADTELKVLKEALLYESKEAAREELSASSERIQGLENSMTKTADKYQSLFNQTTEKQGNLKSEESSLSRYTQETKRTEEAFYCEITIQRFTDVDDYHGAVLTTEIIEKLQEAYQSYREEVIKNDENLKNYNEQTEGKSKILTDHMEEEKAALEKMKVQLGDASKTVYGIRTRDESIYNKVTRLLECRKEARDEYMIISRLDATANGKLSQCHMNFQTYIQRKYFKSILNEANHRLYKMSNGQFILQCRDVKELSGQGEVGLDLDVYSMVNDQTRDVKTLSGGESFIAALAMALGMADIIQNTAGSIHIDTMFIDEGFGSLSDETRIQAINILNELSEGKRLVGIISHVTELKAQIGTKLVVTKGEKGSKVKWEIGE